MEINAYDFLGQLFFLIYRSTSNESYDCIFRHFKRLRLDSICSTPAMIPKCSKNKSKGALSTFDVGIYRFLCLLHVSEIMTKGSTELKVKRDGLLKSKNLFHKSN